MHIREDLIYDKHCGKLVGFVDLGEVNNQLLGFQSHVEGTDNIGSLPHLATSMLTIMVKGILRYLYAHFPCSSFTGDLLFQPFWQTVVRLETIGFKGSLLYAL